MNLSEKIQKEVAEIDFDELVKEEVKTNVSKMVKRIVSEQLKSYSDLGLKIEKHVSESIAFDPSSIKLPDYRKFVVEEVNKSIASFTTTEQAKEIHKYINERVVGEHRKEIEFDDFIQELNDMILSSIADSNEWQSLEVIVSRDVSRLSEDFSLSILDPNASRSFSSSEKGKTLFKASFWKDGRIYYIRDEEDVLTSMQQVSTWFKALKFKRTKILNIDDYETTVDRYDY